MPSILARGETRASRIATAAQLACVLEVMAPKPGNVSPGRDFADIRFEDFVASASAIGLPFAAAGSVSLGVLVWRAVEATAGWSSSNTNLGIVLLLAPLARAAHEALLESGNPLVIAASELRTALRATLDATTVADAADVYAAIRLASPGGLGRAVSQDVSSEPTVTLSEAMRLAADRDGIAAEYANGFAVTFDEAVPALRRARHEGLSWNDAIVETFLNVLAGHVDTHIARRSGADAAARASSLAAAAVAAGGVRTAEGRRTIAQMDHEMRDDGNTMNPGTTADLMAGAIFVELLAGGWRRPGDDTVGRQ
jgi:triphosphoribosyl-dephospho-CoA synthase